jgi:hypothetical protein
MATNAPAAASAHLPYCPWQLNQQAGILLVVFPFHLSFTGLVNATLRQLPTLLG